MVVYCFLFCLFAVYFGEHKQIFRRVVIIMFVCACMRAWVKLCHLLLLLCVFIGQAELIDRSTSHPRCGQPDRQTRQKREEESSQAPDCREKPTSGRKTAEKQRPVFGETVKSLPSYPQCIHTSQPARPAHATDSCDAARCCYPRGGSDRGWEVYGLSRARLIRKPRLQAGGRTQGSFAQVE